MSPKIPIEDGAQGDSPDFGKFKKPDPAFLEAERREKERLRAQSRRAKEKENRRGVTDAGSAISFSASDCTMLNDWMLGLAGGMTGRSVLVSKEQHDRLDECLAKIGNKYGGFLAGYMSEIVYVSTFVLVIRQSPKIEPPADAEEVKSAEPEKPDSGNLGPQG